MLVTSRTRAWPAGQDLVLCPLDVLARGAGLRPSGWPFLRALLVKTAPQHAGEACVRGEQPPRSGWALLRTLLGNIRPAPRKPDPREDLPPLAEEALARLLGLGLLEAEGDTRLRLHRLLAAFAWETLDGPGAFAAFAPAAFQWVVVLIDTAADLWPARNEDGTTKA